MSIEFMANNLSPSAREFLRACHQNNLQGLQKYIDGRSYDVDIVFRGMIEAVRYKNWDTFFYVFDFASVKFKTHPQRFAHMAEEVCWDIIDLTNSQNASQVSSVLDKVVPLCRPAKIANAMHAAVQKNKNVVFDKLLPKFRPIPGRLTYETLFCIGLDNKNDAIQNVLFDRIDVNKVRSTLQSSHDYEYNRQKNRTQSNIDRFEAMVFNKNLTHILQSEPRPQTQLVRRKM